MAGPPLLEVSCATDVAVGGEGARRGGWAQWLLIEVVPQDRVQTLVADRTGEQSAFGSRFHAGRWIALAQADDAETRTVAHLGMRERRQDLLYHLRGLRTHGARPPDHARRRPVQVRPVRGGPMFGVGHGGVRFAHTHMRSDALALMEDLDGGGRSA